jgi:hypothetical protein
MKTLNLACLSSDIMVLDNWKITCIDLEKNSSLAVLTKQILHGVVSIIFIPEEFILTYEYLNASL